MNSVTTTSDDVYIRGTCRIVNKTGHLTIRSGTSTNPFVVSGLWPNGTDYNPTLINANSSWSTSDWSLVSSNIYEYAYTQRKEVGIS